MKYVYLFCKKIQSRTTFNLNFAKEIGGIQKLFKNKKGKEC